MPNRQTYTQYTVVKGDTLAAIAKRFGSTVAAIAVTSGVADPNKITVGQVLSIPPTDAVSVAKPTSAPKTDPRTIPPDSSAGTQGGIAAWFQPPRLWFTIGTLATIAWAIWRETRKR